MTEIRIYQCLWKNMLLVVLCFTLAAGGYQTIQNMHAGWVTKVFGGWLGNYSSVVADCFSFSRHSITGFAIFRF